MIVIGVVAGVIVATVAVIIPWAQDEAAKGNLHAFGDANAVAHVTDGAWLGAWVSKRPTRMILAFHYWFLRYQPILCSFIA